MCGEVPFHRKYKQLFCFILEGVNKRMQLHFLASVEIFLKQLNGYSFWPGRYYCFVDIQFSCFVLCHVCICIRNGTFDHCGRSKAWNTTHHGRYVFQTWCFSWEMSKKWHRQVYMNTDMYMCAYRYMYMCVYVCVFFLLCVAVSRRVSRVVVGWVVGCGVVLSTCRCRGGLCPCVVVPLIASSQKKEEERARVKWREGRWTNSLKSVRMMSTLQRARAERSMIELAPLSKYVRSKGFFGEPLGSSENPYVGRCW